MSDNLGAYKLNTIHCGHSEQLMLALPGDSIDLVVTSPPYGQLRAYDGYYMAFKPMAEQIARVLKIGGVLVWVEGDESDELGESGVSFQHALYFRNECSLRLHDTMIYMKAGASYPSQDKYYQCFEYMFILSKGKPKTFNPLKDRENRWYGQKWSKVRTRRQQDGSLSSQTWDADEGEKYGVRFNIWQYAVGAGNHGDPICHEHPAPFPEALARDHILSWSSPGDIVFDPMCGSGTTLAMAHQEGRKWLGFDISQKYCELSERRVRNVTPSFMSML